MNLPNKLTLTRIILVPVFMIFVSLSQYMTPSYNPRWYLIAGIIFAVASFTDYLDGHLARKWHMVTDFGKFADPLADKLLTTVAFIYMMRDGVCSPVVLCIILAREFAVSGMRLVAVEQGRVIAAAWSGKVKTASTMVCLCLMLVFQSNLLNVVCIAVIVATTVYSGIEYFAKNLDVFKEAD